MLFGIIILKKAEKLISTGILSRSLYEQIKKLIIPVVDEVYPNNWDIQLIPFRAEDFPSYCSYGPVSVFSTLPVIRYIPMLVIYFPKLFMEGEGVNTTHELTDLLI